MCDRHGGADFIISSDNSPRYYEYVSDTMDLSPSELDDFYRYFLVSGTGHCGGGDGAHAIGQGTGEVNSYDPKENVLMAIVDWVEKGNAPETLIGTKWVNDTQSLGNANLRSVREKYANFTYTRRRRFPTRALQIPKDQPVQRIGQPRRHRKLGMCRDRSMSQSQIKCHRQVSRLRRIHRRFWSQQLHFGSSPAC
jgi:hypothetical protein